MSCTPRPTVPRSPDGRGRIIHEVPLLFFGGALLAAAAILAKKMQVGRTKGGLLTQEEGRNHATR
jgi:hypothetical protein